MTRNEVKDRIHADPTPIYSLMEKAKTKVKGKDTYVCPFCGHGKGGDGIALNDDGKFHCFSCEKTGDAIDLYQQIRGISDFNTAFIAVAQLYGLTLDQPTEKQPQKMSFDKFQETVIDNKINPIIEAQIISAQTQQNRTNPQYVEYLNRRGISPETAQHFKCGFLPSWQHPKVVERGLNPPATPRFIIPTGAQSYLARDTRPAEQIPSEQEQFKKQKVGTAEIFNAESIPSATQPIFIVEGEFDAMSFYEVGAQAIGLGSTGNRKKLIEYLTTPANRPSGFLIIALDNDEAGKKATGELASDLKNLNISYSIADPDFLFNGEKDANDALIKDRGEFTARIHRTERAELDAETNAAYLDDLQQTFAQFPKPLPTGFSYLDDLLDGGLMNGLYFVGGVSSTGKTAFCMQLVDQVAKAGGSSLVFAAEMSRAELVARSISRETVAAGNGNEGLYYTQREVQAGYRYAQYSEGKRTNLQTAFEAYRKYAGRITVYENNGENMKPSVIRDRITKYCYLTGERPLVLVDYLQILTPENDRQDIRQTVDKAIVALKGISANFSLPIIVISSLNRDNYTKPLSKSAFKESGNIEYGADYLLGLQFSCVHTPQFDNQNENNRPRLSKILQEEGQKPIREVEISILKQRGGRSSGIVRFAYDAWHNSYEQCQTVEDYLTSNFTDTDEQRRHREKLTGQRISPEYCPPITKRARPL